MPLRSVKMFQPWQKRLMKEIKHLVTEPPKGVQLLEPPMTSDLRSLNIVLFGAPNTLYDGEHFELQFQFNEHYPFHCPQVTFIGENIPVHPHVYSNGHICLSTLSDDWTPALSISAICLSILSMLSSCKKKERPRDNAIYVKTCNKNPNKTQWWFHDDKI
uniref:N-terminal E2 ubiquitin-conjugating enzyme n=1 Tax=Strongyloides venezuelensis TaxID=75913 RepID=A0A0K0F2T4_STRVS